MSKLNKRDKRDKQKQQFWNIETNKRPPKQLNQGKGIVFFLAVVFVWGFGLVLVECFTEMWGSSDQSYDLKSGSLQVFVYHLFRREADIQEKANKRITAHPFLSCSEQLSSGSEYVFFTQPWKCPSSDSLFLEGCQSTLLLLECDLYNITTYPGYKLPRRNKTCNMKQILTIKKRHFENV